MGGGPAVADREALLLAALVAAHRRRLGLSQSALAAMAGCSRQYVGQLEAGKRRRPSLFMVRSLADALDLDGADRGAFFAVAGYPPDANPPRADPFAALPLILEAAGAIRYPAYVHDSLWRLFGWNRAAERLFEVDPASIVQGATSLLEFVFDPLYRVRFPGWEPWARTVLAQFKRDARAALRHPDGHDLLRNLRRAPDFVRLWRTVEPAPSDAPAIVLRLRHDRYGLLHLQALRALSPARPWMWLNIFIPATALTRAALDEMTGLAANPHSGE